MGQAEGAAPPHGAPCRPEEARGDGPPREAPGNPLFLGLRFLDRELEPAEDGGRRSDEPLPLLHPPQGRRDQGGGRAHPFRGAARQHSRGPSGDDALGRGAHQGGDDDRLHPVPELRRTRRGAGRGQCARGERPLRPRHGGRPAALLLPAGRPGPGPDRSDERRASPQQLLAVGGGLQRVLLHGHPLARFRRGRPRRGPWELRRAGEALWRAQIRAASLFCAR